PGMLVTTTRPPVTHTVPVAFAIVPMLRNESHTFVPPAIVNVPREPALRPTRKSLVRKKAFETVIWPVPSRPTTDSTPKFVTVKLPALSQTVPVAPAFSPTVRPLKVVG